MLLLRPQIAPVDVAILRFCVDDPWFQVVNGHVKTIAAMDYLPVFIGNPVARQRLNWSAPASVVLQAPTNVIRLFVVEADFIKLPDGDGVDEVPALARVVAPVNPAVGTRDHAVRIRRVDPHRVKVAV